MKRFYGFALIGVLVFPLWSQTSQDSVYFTRSGSSDILQHLYLIPNETVDLDLVFRTGADIGGVVTPIWFDNTVLSLGTYAGNTTDFNEADTSYFVYENAQAVADSQKVLFAIIQGKQSIPTGVYPAGSFQVTAVGSEGTVVSDAFQSAFWPPTSSMRFINTAGTSDWIPTFTSLTLHIISCGDVNGDGFVDGNDASYLANYANFGGPAPLSLAGADVNNDGFIDGNDASYIINYANFGGPAPNCGTRLSKEPGKEINAPVFKRSAGKHSLEGKKPIKPQVR